MFCVYEETDSTLIQNKVHLETDGQEQQQNGMEGKTNGWVSGHTERQTDRSRIKSGGPHISSLFVSRIKEKSFQVVVQVIVRGFGRQRRL